MIEHPNLTHIGQVAVFYLPFDKLFTRYHSSGKMVNGFIHEFLIENYDAYTMESGNAQGWWRRHKGGKVYHDASTATRSASADPRRSPPSSTFSTRSARRWTRRPST